MEAIEAASSSGAYDKYEYDGLDLQLITANHDEDDEQRVRKEVNLDKLLSVKEDPSAFKPTNFHVIWPPEEPHQSSKNTWALRDVDDEKNKRLTAKDFAERLHVYNMPGSKIFRSNPGRLQMPSTTGVLIAPGSYGAPIVNASVNLEHSALRPQQTRSAHAFNLTAQPAPGTYAPRYDSIDPNLRSVQFGGASKVTQLSSMRLLKEESGTGPGTYDPRRVEGHQPCTNFDKQVRLADNDGTRLREHPTPGPGQYNARPVQPNSFSVHFSFNSQQKYMQTHRSLGNGPGSYTLPPLTSQTHKFSASTRFAGDPILRIFSHTQRHTLSSDSAEYLSVKPSHLDSINFKQFSKKSREQKLLEAKAARADRRYHANAKRQDATFEHETKMDKIVNKQKYAEEERKKEEHANKCTKLAMGWLFNIAHVNRLVRFSNALIQGRHATYLAVIKKQAASVILHYLRQYMAKVHAKIRLNAGRCILRTLLRNVGVQFRRREREASKILVTVHASLIKRQAFRAVIERYRYQAILIQRAWRRFAVSRRARLLLLHHQWDHLEQLLCEQYKEENGIKKFEKAKKRGLLGNQVQSTKIKNQFIESIPYWFVPAAIKRDLIFDDYQARRAVYLRQLYDYQDTKAHRKLLTDFARLRIEQAEDEVENEDGSIPASMQALKEKLQQEESVSAAVERAVAKRPETRSKTADSKAGSIKKKSVKKEKVFGDLTHLAELNLEDFNGMFFSMPSPYPKPLHFQTLQTATKMFALIARGQNEIVHKDYTEVLRASLLKLMVGIAKSNRRKVKVDKASAGASSEAKRKEIEKQIKLAKKKLDPKNKSGASLDDAQREELEQKIGEWNKSLDALALAEKKKAANVALQFSWANAGDMGGSDDERGRGKTGDASRDRLHIGTTMTGPDAAPITMVRVIHEHRFLPGVNKLSRRLDALQIELGAAARKKKPKKSSLPNVLDGPPTRKK